MMYYIYAHGYLAVNYNFCSTSSSQKVQWTGSPRSFAQRHFRGRKLAALPLHTPLYTSLRPAGYPRVAHYYMVRSSVYGLEVER